MPADAGTRIHAGSPRRSRQHQSRARASEAPTRGHREGPGGALLPRARPTCHSSSGCRTGCGGCSLPPSLSWTGIGAPRSAGQPQLAARGSVLAHSRWAGLGRGRRTVPFAPPGVTPLRLRQWRGRAGCGDLDPRGPLPCAPVPRGRGCGNSTAYLFISDECSTLPWQPLHLFRRQ